MAQDKDLSANMSGQDEKIEKELQTVSENSENAQRPRNLRTRIFMLRALYSAVTGGVVLVLSFFYTVLAAQGGKRMWFSVGRLCLNCLKNARNFLTGGKTDAGQHSFYLMLLFGAAAALLCFLAAAALGICGALFSYRAMRAGAGSEEQKRQKILFRVLFPNRVVYYLINLLYLPLTFFSEYFSAVCTRFLEISGGSVILFVICNVTAIVLGVLLLAGAVLAVLEYRMNRGTCYDMLHIVRSDSTEQ